MNAAMWQEIRQAFQWVDATPEARVAVLQGEGRYFTAGIDLQLMMGLGPQIANECDGRTREALRRVILDMQDTLTSLERCRKAGARGHSWRLHRRGYRPHYLRRHSVLQRGRQLHNQGDRHRHDRGRGHPAAPARLVGEGITRELAYNRAHIRCGRGPKHRPGEPGVRQPRSVGGPGVREIAATIAAKSPLSIRGTKEMITYAREHSVADGLNYIATWNAAMLMSKDLTEAMTANLAKRTPDVQGLNPGAAAGIADAPPRPGFRSQPRVAWCAAIRRVSGERSQWRRPRSRRAPRVWR
jgi:enoyl-CoA hydratase